MQSPTTTQTTPLTDAMIAIAAVSVRLFEPYLASRRAANQSEWDDPRCWRLGFYFGRGDTRLWVPRRHRDGTANDAELVINFGHPEGRKAFRILALGYAIGAVTVGMLVAIALGVRW